MPLQTSHAPRLAVRPLSAALVVILAAVGANALGRGTAQRTMTQKLRSGPGIANHPVHVVPSSNVRIPEGWPLDADGTLSCSTCHNALPALVGASDFQLRGDTDPTAPPTQFCINCHDSGTERNTASMHWLATGRAHIPDDAARESYGGGGMDSESRRCLGCHDGVTAGEHLNSSGFGAAVSFGEQMRSHPVGIPYERRGRRGGDAALRSEVQLPDSVRLPGGSVSCVSCHNLYATGRHKLSVPIEGSKLCFTCHGMD